MQNNICGIVVPSLYGHSAFTSFIITATTTGIALFHYVFFGIYVLAVLLATEDA